MKHSCDDKMIQNNFGHLENLHPLDTVEQEQMYKNVLNCHLATFV